MMPLISKASLAIDDSFIESNINNKIMMAPIPGLDTVFSVEQFKSYKFEPYNAENFPEERQSFIIKLSLNNTSSKDLEFVIGTSLFDYITIFYVDAKGIVHSARSGLKYPSKNKDLLMGANSYLPFILPKGEHDIILLASYDKKIAYQYAQLPFTLYSRERFDALEKDSDASLHFFLGAIIIMTLYNLALYFVVRKKFYLYYIINNIVIMFFVLGLDGYLETHFFSTFEYHEKLILIIGNISFIFYMLFTKSILNFKKWDPKWDRRVKYGLIIWFCLLVFVAIDMEIIAVALGSIGVFMGYTIVIVSSIKGIRAGAARAKYFLIGNICYYIGVIVSILQINGILHSTVFGLTSIETTELTTMIQLALFSLTLGSTINYMRDKLDKKEIEQQKQKQEAQRKYAELIEVKNQELEYKVIERTQELRESALIIEQKNKDITNSITYARRIQRALLPANEIWEGALSNHFVFYKPKDIVSGDFYWLNHSPELGTLFFAACDCTGHGVPGAMVSVVGVNNLNRCINEFKLAKPSDILNRLNLLFEESFEMGSKEKGEINDGMDIALVALDFLSNGHGNFPKARLQFSGANNPLWVVRKTRPDSPNVIASAMGYELIELKPNKQPIGRFTDRKPFTNEEIDLYENDCLYLFTDGYADQFGGPQGKKFKQKQLRDFLLSIQEFELDNQKQLLYDKFTDWRGTGEQVDDICIIGVKI
ncbi:MAG: 7TM diverse intracellular signaling domain-containing protein [Flavobacteriales bacterium]